MTSSETTTQEMSTSTVYATTVYNNKLCTNRDKLPGWSRNNRENRRLHHSLPRDRNRYRQRKHLNHKVALPPSPPPLASSTTSTVYATRIYPITSCASTVIDCDVGQKSTEIISLYTTVYPVTDASVKTSAPAVTSIPAGLTEAPAGYITSTVYEMRVETITKCPLAIPNCPISSMITKTIAVSTTICPVTEVEAKPATGSSASMGAKTPRLLPFSKSQELCKFHRFMESRLLLTQLLPVQPPHSRLSQARLASLLALVASPTRL